MRERVIAPTLSIVRGGSYADQRAPLFMLSVIAGYVDTAGYLALFGLFPSHVTGDLVTFGAFANEHEKAGMLSRVAMLPLFMVSVAVSSLVARRARARGHEPLVSMLLLVTLGLCVFGGLGVALAARAQSADGLPVIAVGGAAVIAMGTQNALMREAYRGVLPTTVMTGNLTQFTIHLVELWENRGSQRRARRAEVRAQLAHVAGPLLGFLLGVLLGGYLTGHFGLLSIGAPALLAAGLTVRARLAGRTQDDPPRSSGIWRRYEGRFARAARAELAADAAAERAKTKASA